RASYPHLSLGGPGDAATAVLDLCAFRAPDADLLAFDRAVHAAEDRTARAGPLHLRLCADLDADTFAASALQAVRRYQRWFARRNGHSQGSRFDEVLRRHRALHDLDKPLVRADYDHALDVWQWLLTLAPHATLPLQAAAL